MHVILANATVLQNKNRSNEHFVILGEIEPMLQYIIANSAGQREAQLTGDPRYLSNFAHALQYIADEKNFTLIQIPRINKILPQKSLFYIMSNTQKFPLTQEDGYTAISHRDFGQVSIYVLSNHL